ncbi:polarized growth protein [Cordyceps fumosorosea ARSEF 2679]|uniref:Polarized growth protein n=1 Tax=Cordyceps fumosorosea (strain ARSEF 2679) TaxID=1081104 RepID=A0A162M4S7_CORFA|nr:polarized growth protein [Cordyceps fumosorosea ARSEF 2679]OAA50730.1 polarized growth protein [Cordyceps fumosorosea ARSEF 2679]
MSGPIPPRGPADGPRPEVGDTLFVIHDFHARSSDELSLGKGDRVELIERDDEFGDGWFLGRHLLNGNTGLFPEVYTRPAPKNIPGPSPAAPAEAPTHPTATAGSPAPPTPTTSTANDTPAPSSTKEPDAASISLSIPTLSEVSLPQSAPSQTGDASPAVPTTGLSPQQSSGHDSRVLSDTLNVIDEHITRLRSPISTGSNLRNHANDSGSEYSAPIDHRMSYIRGEETDEEEDVSHTKQEVQAWSADQVAEYLFEAGVEKQHCEVFRDQEISGEVLLGMDQSSLFIKAFDLGSVGRRLKTWHKIKALQDEVANNDASVKRPRYGSDAGSEGTRNRRSRTNTVTTSGSNRPSSISTRHLAQAPKVSPTTQVTPASPQRMADSRPGHAKRPSAASIRELHHSRRHSSTDFRIAPAAAPSPALPPLTPVEGHRKQPSFDRNWTLGNAFAQPGARPMSSAGLHDLIPSEKAQDSAVDLDRGYFSGTDAEGRRRNVLKKRESTAHSRQSSYAEEQRIRSATALSRHSRFGSVDSYRDGPSTAAQKYYGIQPAVHGRSISTNTTESFRPLPPLKDNVPPPVTKLDSNRAQPAPKQQGFNSDWLANVVSRPGQKQSRNGMRAISEKLTLERRASPSDTSAKDSASFSPATGQSTPSVAPSLEKDSPDVTSQNNSAATAPIKGKKKGKKGTSAYTRGLLKIGPTEAKEGAEYFGWMRKKSSHLMTTWKPRFFVLKGRRLSYYYSEDDTEEKGLIDISFHRVLPADNDRLTGLHATIANAVGGPSIPNSSLSPDMEKSNEPVFIFKLVPPRAGLSRAVNFTKPMVHYFAVPNVGQGRLWMAAMMKATIDRDDAAPITTTYQQKTISLTKAKQMRHRPPALMNLDEMADEEKRAEGPAAAAAASGGHNSLGIFAETDSGVSGLDKARLNGVLSAADNDTMPQSA